MPVFLVTSPDGRKLRVTAPEGATQEQAITYAQQQLGRQPEEESARERLKRNNPSEYDPDSPEYQAKYGATAGMSGANRFLAGAGKAFVDIGHGARQLATETGGMLGLVDDSIVANQRAQEDERSRMDASLMSTGAGAAGNVLTNIGMAVVPGTLVAKGAQLANMGRTAAVARAFANPGTYRAAAASGAALGATQPVGTDDSRTVNTALNAGLGVGGLAVLRGGARIAQPIRNALSPEDARSVRTLLDADVPLDVQQRTGSNALAGVKRALDDNPITKPAQQALAERQQRAFTRAVLKLIGEDADAATQDVMGKAATRIGKVFDDVAERNPVRYDGQMHSALRNIVQDVRRELPSDEARLIYSQIDEIFQKAQQGNGAIDGKAYQNLRTSLGRVSAQRSPLGHWAGKLRESLDGALQRSASDTDREALRTARQQYRRMLQIEGAIDAEGAGRISAPKLANALGTKANRRQSVYGRGDVQLVRLAQAGKRVLPDKFPNSGTSARLAAQALAPVALGLGVGAGSGDANKGLMTAAGTAGVMLGAQRGLNSQLTARYLSEGIRTPWLRKILISPASSGALKHSPGSLIPALEQQSLDP